MGKQAKGRKDNSKGKKNGKSHGPIDPPAQHQKERFTAKPSKGGKGRRSRRCGGSDKAEDAEFRNSLQADGRYSILDISADGNCLFRTLSDQLFHDQGRKWHTNVRIAVCDFIEAHKDDFSVFLVLDDDDCKDEEDASDFESYCKKMRQDGEWGGNLELVAAARLYRRNITVFSTTSAMSIPHGHKESSGPDLLLSYHDNDHYNSVQDTTQKQHNKTMDPPESAAAMFEQATSEQTCETEESSGDSGEVCNKPDGRVLKVAGVIPSSSPPSVEERTIASTKSAATTKKHSPCPCGSGKKYRRCCWEQERHKQRKPKPSKDEGSDDDNTTIPATQAVKVHEMNGNFRVLHI
jgi:OTU-like cysteine protease/SEC-C motif